jgi:hypothetical protein
LLTDAGVGTVVDVRIRPDRSSLGSYARARTPDKGIARLLIDAGIGYRSLIELGNPFYEQDVWTSEYTELLTRAGDLLTRRLGEVSPPWCLLCAEKRVAECHRKIIADFLVSRGHEAVHLE